MRATVMLSAVSSTSSMRSRDLISMIRNRLLSTRARRGARATNFAASQRSSSYRIAQVVDGEKGAHIMIEKRRLSRAQLEYPADRR